MTNVIPTEHDKAEWSRFANACYARGLNFYGHRYSVAAATCCTGQAMRCDVFDTLQDTYREWLVFGNYPQGD